MLLDGSRRIAGHSEPRALAVFDRLLCYKFAARGQVSAQMWRGARWHKVCDIKIRQSLFW